jgi:hypothetical protein
MAIARASVLSVLLDEMIGYEEGMEIDSDESAMLLVFMAAKF